jgi:hypothetical protein
MLPCFRSHEAGRRCAVRAQGVGAGGAAPGAAGQPRQPAAARRPGHVGILRRSPPLLPLTVMGIGSCQCRACQSLQAFMTYADRSLPDPALCFLCCAAYMWHLTGPSGAPGLPAWQTPPDTLQAVLNESINLFYINIGLAAVHLNPLPAVASHPVSEASHPDVHNPLRRERCPVFHAPPAALSASTVSPCAMPLQALFNVVIAWSLMLGPLMFSDRKAANVPRKWPLYIGTLVSCLLLQQMPLPGCKRRCGASRMPLSAFLLLHSLSQTYSSSRSLRYASQCQRRLQSSCHARKISAGCRAGAHWLAG